MITFINQTIVNTWNMCPERVRRRWLLGDIIPPGIAPRIGTGLHKGAEVNHLQKITSKKDERLDVIQDAARDAYIESCQNGVYFPPEELPSAKKQLAHGIDETVNLAKTYLDNLAPKILPALVEEDIYLDLPEIEVPLRGTIDVFTEDKWLPDLKTAARKWPQKRADLSLQATMYSKLIANKTGIWPNKISFEIFIKGKNQHQSLITYRQENDFNILVLRIRQMIEGIEAGLFPPAPVDSWWCSPKYCGYYYTCKWIPAHKKLLPKRSV